MRSQLPSWDYGLMNSLTKANDLIDSVSGAFAFFKGQSAEMEANADKRAW